MDGDENGIIRGILVYLFFFRANIMYHHSSVNELQYGQLAADAQ